MILLTVLMILLGSFYKLEEAIPTSLSRLSRPTIILDAGHGGACAKTVPCSNNWR